MAAIELDEGGDQEYEVLDAALERSGLPIPGYAPENGSLGESSVAPGCTLGVGGRR